MLHNNANQRIFVLNTAKAGLIQWLDSSLKLHVVRDCHFFKIIV